MTLSASTAWCSACRTMTDSIERDTLQRHLSDLARLGARYGFELVPDIRQGSMRIKPISPKQGGYLAERVDDGPRVLSSYGSGVARDDPTDGVVGDDMHPTAREKRARQWSDENAAAISAKGLLPLLRSWDRLDGD